MQRGTELEPSARAAYEAQTGLVMQPLVIEDGAYSASLDGMTLAGDLVLEIKCPMRGTRSDLWQDVSQGQVPEHYRVQVQHQLMVSDAEKAHLWVFDGAKGILTEVTRDEALMTWSQAAEAYAGAKQYADEAAKRLESARQALIELAQHPKEEGAGVTVTRFWKQGSVDYKKVPELTGIDLERYRKRATEEVRVTVAA